MSIMSPEFSVMVRARIAPMPLTVSRWRNAAVSLAYSLTASSSVAVSASRLRITERLALTASPPP